MAPPINKAKFNWQTLIRDWPASTKKQLKPDPAPLLEKWGTMQVEYNKKLAELMALDQKIWQQVHGINSILDGFSHHVPAPDHKSWDLFRKLIAEYHSVFCRSAAALFENGHIRGDAK